jgi:hypothetical protein
MTVAPGTAGVIVRGAGAVSLPGLAGGKYAGVLAGSKPEGEPGNTGIGGSGPGSTPITGSTAPTPP